jgi:hypothetical protein
MSTAFNEEFTFLCLVLLGEELLCHGNGSPDEILPICLTQDKLDSFWQVK